MSCSTASGFIVHLPGAYTTCLLTYQNLLIVADQSPKGYQLVKNLLADAEGCLQTAILSTRHSSAGYYLIKNLLVFLEIAILHLTSRRREVSRDAPRFGK